MGRAAVRQAAREEIGVRDGISQQVQRLVAFLRLQPVDAEDDPALRFERGNTPLIA